MKVWDSCERNGYVFVWHHAENEPPTWEIPSVPEIENGTWVYRGRSDYMIHCHIQVIFLKFHLYLLYIIILMEIRGSLTIREIEEEIKRCY